MKLSRDVTEHLHKGYQFAFRRPPYIGYVVVAFLILFVLTQLHGSDTVHQTVLEKEKVHTSWNFELDRRNLIFNEAQCSEKFPGLFDNIDVLVKAQKGKRITSATLDGIPRRNGYLRVLLYDQELYVVATEGNIYSRSYAILQAIHRAVVSSPDTLPNIEFVLNTDDKLPPAPIWSLARESSDAQTWLMPDYGFWSWPETKVGSYNEVQRKAAAMEDTKENPTGRAWPWEAKNTTLLWRGALMGLDVRQRFLEATAGQPWADVKAIDWHDADSMHTSLKSMDEHCQHKYLAHIEGNSYSGRLKYLQNCRSVIVAHQMDWQQHYTHLMIPSGPSQNYVQVNRDLSDLESTMLMLQNDDKWALEIANNNVAAFRERYLTPAAQVCYWRYLIRSWAKVSFTPSPWEMKDGIRNWRGLSVESYLLERRMDWDPY